MFCQTFLKAGYDSLMVTMVAYYGMSSNFIEDSGYTEDIWACGAMIFGMIVVISNLKVLILSNDHSIASIFVIFGSIVLYLLSFILVSNVLFAGGNLYNKFVPMFSTPNFHFGNFLILGLTTLVDMGLTWHGRWK